MTATVQQGADVPLPPPTRISWGRGATPGSALLVVDVDADGVPRLVRCSAAAAPDGPLEDPAVALPLVELALGGDGSLSGGTPNDRHQKSESSARLRFVSAERQLSPDRESLTLHLRDPERGLAVRVHVEQLRQLPVLRWTTEIVNHGAEAVVLAYLSSFVYAGFAGAASARWDTDLRIGVAHNGWCGELRWLSQRPVDLGLRNVGLNGGSSRKRYAVTARGSWSSADHLPMGSVHRPGTGECWLWQIEHNGAWHWEIGDRGGDLYLAASGPTSAEHDWRRRLAPGDRFTSVPVTVAMSASGLDDAFGALTRHRRAARRPHPDNVDLPIVFNDYMNCLDGDPSTERLLPLVDAAADLGAEVFCLDAGWYADADDWWDEVGEWRPSARRFPGGLDEVFRRIRDRGMVPGLWLEPEVVGARSSAVGELPPEAYFHRDGEIVRESGRHQLDLRHPAVIDRLDRIVDRLIADHGLGYLKFDHNINAGVGTEIDAYSWGDGLLGHNRAHLEWLDRLLDRHPTVTVENCAAGGMRMDYALLARLPVQSTSDQRDHLAYPAIAAAAPSGVTPEQGAVWAYPQPWMDDEQIALTMINAMLGRIHLSGRADHLDPHQRDLVRSGLSAYANYRRRLAAAVPLWPLGLPTWDDDWLALGLRDGHDLWLAVWRRGGPATVRLPLPTLPPTDHTVTIVYPRELPVTASHHADARMLTIDLPAAPAARLLHLAPTNPPSRPRNGS
ncbi:alpha-galactosidase [Micromonospora sp. 067-2]|uniref:alpha-galactosidase n=1 Tax=Micromonospora sp. 067-2 TaxID=2789270 RepID=UPI003978760D